jgi:rubredoxin
MLRMCLRGLGFPEVPVATMPFHCSDPHRIVSEPRTWMCLICGWIYDEAAGDPEHGIAPGTAWADVPMNWTCPECGARKEDFEMVQI